MDDFEADDFEQDPTDDFEPDSTEQAIAAPGFNTAGKALLGGIGKLSQTLDEHTVAPVRSYISRAQGSDQPNPQWKDIYARAGISDAPSIKSPVALNPWDDKETRMSPAGIAGGITGAVTDPLNYIPIPGSSLAKGAGRLADAAVGATERGLKNFASERMAKAALGSDITNLRQAVGTTKRGISDTEEAFRRVREIGDTVSKDKVGGWASTTEGIGRRSLKPFKETSEKFEQISSSVDELFPQGAVSAEGISDEILQYASRLPPTERGKALQERLLKEAENFSNKGRMSFAEAQQWKNDFKFKPQDNDALVSNADAVNAVNRIIGKSMDETVEAASKTPGLPPSQKQLLESYSDVKKRYGIYKKITQSATDRALKDYSIRKMSLTDHLAWLAGGGAAGVGGGVPGAVFGGAAAAGAYHLGRTRGSAFASKAADALRSVVAKSPKNFERWGPTLYKAAQAGNTSLVVTHQLLMNTDPNYRQMFTNEAKN